jgi:hypothetical protein
MMSRELQMSLITNFIIEFMINMFTLIKSFIKNLFNKSKQEDNNLLVDIGGGGKKGLKRDRKMKK